eukprot:TRINITY_DN7229_c0_g1_i2.p1 TRINITY_DN7229_c0_g1~~TRINITY_DN7229_c0_g1_i2.p1  ORF type:complete len:360 (+),score=65.48 TRINITY_DN7229_c0_g1_i2:389-1468(+)
MVCNTRADSPDVGLPSGKSLFQIQAEKLVRLKQIVSKSFNKENVSIPWYIMTSDAVDTTTRSYFEKNNYFGLEKDSVVFFRQEDIPCLTPDGKIMLESASKIAMAPNGNGGVWQALKDKGILDDMEKRGVVWIASYCVDNILVKIADPLFLGWCIDSNLDIGSKVVAKAYPEEKVGVLAVKNKKFTVLEYSEIDEQKRYQKTTCGNLAFNASHLVINNLSLQFVKKNCSIGLPLHIAKKKIPCADENGKTSTPNDINGWKIEMFVFDIFECASNLKALESFREEEFAPLKNSMESPTDNPKTCRDLLSNLHKKWIESAGGILVNKEEACEISPLVSYDGENLESLKGKEIKLPTYIDKI